MEVFHSDKRDAGVRWLGEEGLSEEEAQDLVSKAFMALVDASPEDPEAFYWVTLRKLLAEHRRRQKERDVQLEWIRRALHRSGPVPDEELFEKECRELVEALVRDVPEGQAEVARLLLHEWTVAEIAEELRIKPSTVRTQRERLREHLGPLWPDDLRPGDPPPDAPDGDLPKGRG